MKKINFLIVFLLATVLVCAQKKQYIITIKDAATASDVSSASVKIRGSGAGVYANENGVATIQANSGDVVDISSVGYNLVTITLSNETNVTVSLSKSATDLSDVVVVGSRGAARVKNETAVPIDVIKINQVGLPSARMDLTSNLNIAAPSFNYNKQSGSDGADNIELGTLRGLGPDQTLVLINGKRRHQTAFVALFGTRGKGSSGTDLNGFAQSAVDRIEILRDGASAQYGSDAIAGVMNIVLNKNVNHWNINLGWSGYYDTKFNANKFNAGNHYISGKDIDGGMFSISANNGFNVGKQGGFVNIGIDYRTQAKTFRQADTTNWRTDKDALPFLNLGRRAFGDGSIKVGGITYNMELAIKNSTAMFYSFGGVNSKESEAYAYTRNLSWNPNRFPISGVGGTPIIDTRLMKTDAGGEVYYNPLIGSKINDASITLGFKGVSKNSWKWDVSLITGKNDFQYNGDGTYNASLIGNISQNYFVDGGFRFRQATLNVDLSKNFPKVAQGLNVGYGLEYRNEKYNINKGEEGSYANYNPVSGQSSGSQGFPGFSPEDMVNAKRNSLSAYVDGEINVTDKWLVNAAVRAENYSDFGSVVTFKIATRYKVANNFNLRASGSTGFRAPSLQQINFSNTVTNFIGGNLVSTRYATNTSKYARSAGIPSLKQETSINGSLGFSYKPTNNLTITVDGYMVKIKDRVVLGGAFYAADKSLPTSFTDLLNADSIYSAQFFANAVNTTNYGIDVVADYLKKWNNKSFRALITGNIQKININKINVPSAFSGTDLSRKSFFTDRDISLLKASAPTAKANINLSYGINKLTIISNTTYFGNIKTLGFGVATASNPNGNGINPQVPSDANPNNLIPEVYNYKGKIVTDLSVAYKLCKGTTWFVGVDNVLNAHPGFSKAQGAKNHEFSYNETGGPWESTQMGYNGRRLFTRLVFNF